MPPRKRRPSRVVIPDTTVVPPATTNLPDELLEFIFDAVPREDVMSLQLCQSRFRALARPRLYTTLVVQVSDKPEINDENDSDDDWYRRVRYQDQSDLDSEDSDYIHAETERARKRITANEKKRLEFWKSPHIAPCVHTCSLIGTETMKEDHILLIATFFKRLPRLVKLQRLTLTQTTYDIARFKIIQALPDLRHLECANFVPGNPRGSATEWASVAPLHLETLKLHFSGDSSPSIAYPLTQHIRHDTLRLLSLTGRATHVYQQIASGDSFPHVGHLIVGAKKLHHTPSDRRAFLSKFPQTKFLMYSSWKVDYQTPIASPVALPALNEFAGDCRVLPLILPTAALKTLVIDRCRPQGIISVFQNKDTSSIASLHLTLSSLVFPNLVRLSDCLPHLVILRLEITQTSPFR
ncbi:hypothetical protein C8F01DRAFT_454952 [Mycena amicta]|nr:hypothetical protein C8F01DRAFT_454952 [Mycena amicta]